MYVVPKNKAEEQKIINEVQEIFSTPVEYNGIKYSHNYKMLAIKRDSFLDSTSKFYHYASFLSSHFNNSPFDECYQATENDLSDYKLHYHIEQSLRSIKNDMNLDDERVICFAQPIYCVGTKTFRTAEALMRLKLDDQIIYPDKFIELAEKIGCIHTLSMIMLNKVCKQIKELEKENSFDAITLVEGVEDDAMNSYAIQSGFEYIQGYKYSIPRPIEELSDFFDKSNK